MASCEAVPSGVQEGADGLAVGTGGLVASNDDTSQNVSSMGNPTSSSNAPVTTMPKFELPEETPGQCVASGLHTTALFDLTGKTALVTGANGGIGGGMARGLAEAGADIVIFKIPGEQSNFHQVLSADTGRKVSVYACDMGNTAMIRETIQKVFDDGLSVDILCNVAGISSGSIPILHETDQHKDAVSKTVFSKSMGCTDQVLTDYPNQFQLGMGTLPMRRKTHGGTKARGQNHQYLLLGGPQGHDNFFRVRAHEGSSRPVDECFCERIRSLQYPSQCNLPRVNNTPLNYTTDILTISRWIATALAARFINDKEANAKILSGVPARRWGTPDDFKGITVFLASRASDYVNGARIFLDGGAHSM